MPVLTVRPVRALLAAAHGSPAQSWPCSRAARRPPRPLHRRGGGAASTAAAGAAGAVSQAVLNAANAVFSGAPVGPQQRQVVVIDPLVNGVTGEQSVATQQIQDQIVALAQDEVSAVRHPAVLRRSGQQGADVMVGTFTPVNAQGQTAGTREGYRFCLVMVDLRAGKTVAKGVARARMDGVDATPIGFFRDSPAWTNDASVKSYIDTCQATKVGDPISQTYLNGILTASIVSEAIDAYDASRYREALDLYTTAEKTPAGNQLRVYNGLYLTNWKLGQRDQAEDAFGRVVDYGLDNNALGVKILFRPGSTSLDTAQQTHRALRHVAEADRRSQREPECLPAGDRQQQPVGLRRTQ